MHSPNTTAITRNSTGNCPYIPSIEASTDGRQLSQCSSQKNVLFSRAPSRPIRSASSSLATIGRANISLWPWAKPQEGLGFTPTREGTPDLTSVTLIKPEASATTSDAAAAAVSSPAQPPTPLSTADPLLEPTPLPQIESIDDAQSLLDAVQTPAITEDHIGFLKEMGIQYGFPYFTNGLQWVMEHMHVYVGTEWWATIALSAIAVRAVMFVPFALASHHTAKLSVINPYLDGAKQRMQQARDSKDVALQQQVSAEMKGLKNAIGLKMTWIFAPMVIQGIAGYCAFKLIRAMAKLPVPGLETGGLLWIPDLTIPDPYFLIPVAMGGFLHLIARVSHSTTP
jgi:YidC/Oxa1 family membrane protein insertase